MWTGCVFWINYARFKVTHTRLDTRKNQTIKTLESNKKILKLIFREIRQEVKRISQENMIEDLNCRARSLDHS